MRRRYEGLSGLRGIGALGIIAYHVYVLSGFVGSHPLFDRTVGNGGVFVQLFFMLSGFSIMCGYFDEFNTNPQLDKFYLGRIKKLVPTFWLALLAHCIVDYIVGTPISKFNVIGTASLMFGFMPQYQESVVMAGWALGIEIIFYLIFPAFFVFNKNKKRSWAFLVFSVIMFVTYEKFYGLGVNQSYINIIRQLVFFAVGALLFHYTDKLDNMSIKKRRVLFVVCILIEILSFFLYGKVNGYIVMVVAFLAVMTNQINYRDYVVNNKLFNGLGKISYQMYLFHMVVYKALYNLGVFNMVNQRLHGLRSYLAQYVLVLIVTIAISYVINKLLIAFRRWRTQHERNIEQETN